MRTTEIERLHEHLQEHAREIRRLKKWRSQVSAGDKIRSTVIIGSVPPGGGGTGIVTTAPCWYLWENQSGAIRQQGTVCVQNGDRTFGVTTTPDDPLVIGILDEDDDVAVGADGFVRHVGFQPVVFTQGVVVAGHYLRTSTTAARAEDAGTIPTAGTFGWALTASAGGAAAVAAYIDTGLRHPAGGGAGISGTANLYLDGVLFCSSNDLNLIEGSGVWISGTCAALGSWEIGAYPAAPSGGGLSGVDFAANGAVLCFGAGLDLQEQAGIWISGTCAAGEATVKIGAYASPAPTSVSGVDWAANDNALGFGVAADLQEDVGIWISGTFVAGEAIYRLGAYPAPAPATAISGTDVLVNDAEVGFARAIDFHEGAGVWISGTFSSPEATVEIGAYPTPAAPTSISGVDFAANDDPLCFGAGLNLQEETGVWISGSCADGEATFHIGATAGGGGDAIWDADHDTGITTEAAPDEDIIRFDIAGAEEMVLGATGLKINHYLAVGPNATVGGADSLVYIRDDANDAPTTNPIGQKLDLTYIGAGAGVIAFGMLLDISYAGVGAGGTGTASYGLSFTAWHESANALAGVYGIRGWVKSAAAGSGPLSIAKACYLTGVWAGAKPATAYGLQVDAGVSASGVTLAYGIRVSDLVATTSYLLNLGPAVPYHRVIGGADPAANQTNVYMKEQATLRQVQTVIADAGGHVAAGSRVMVLV